MSRSKMIAFLSGDAARSVDRQSSRELRCDVSLENGNYDAPRVEFGMTHGIQGYYVHLDIRMPDGTIVKILHKPIDWLLENVSPLA